MKFSSIEVNVKDLLLDPKNPRFIIPPNSDQSDIIDYLLEYEEVVNLAKGINDFEGLMAGERIIVCNEGGHLVVLEGNRRICACKLLLDRTLIPGKYNRFPVINEKTKENIEAIYVDLVPDRESTQSTLYKRHIKGIKDWSTISKYKFYANEFSHGMDIDEIASITSSTPGDVKKGIRLYNLIIKAISLDKWKEDEKPNIYDLEVSRLTRVFDVKSKILDINGAKILKLNYDEKNLEPISELDKEVFEHSIYLIAKAAFFYKKDFNTRNTIDDVPGLFDYLKEKGVIALSNSENSESNNNTDQDKSNNDTDTKPNNNDADQKESDNVTNANSSDKNSNSGPANNTANATRNDAKDSSPSNASRKDNNDSNNNGGNNGKTQSPKAPLFFQALTWTSLNPTKPEHFGIISLASELQKLSVNNHYNNYPIATAMLLRALFEQTLKYYTKHINEWGKLMTHSRRRPGQDPMMGDLVSFYRSNDNFKRFFPDRTIQSAFTCATSQSMLDFFDTNIHNTHIIKATKLELESKAANGLFALIQHILNCA